MERKGRRELEVEKENRGMVVKIEIRGGGRGERRRIETERESSRRGER
jgi:hypothetical protein